MLKAINSHDNKRISSSTSIAKKQGSGRKSVMELVRSRNNNLNTPVKRIEFKFEIPINESCLIDDKEDQEKEKKSNLIVKGIGATKETLKGNYSADGILEEILIILARLEYDRRRTEFLLEQEKSSVKLLNDKIEIYALKRINELPVRVQRAHESSIQDVTELHWHLAYQSKTQARLKNKIEVELKFCSQLEEEIASISKSTPLLEEKISLELKQINKILQEQEQTDEQLKQALNKSNESVERQKQVMQKNQREMELIEEDLNEVKKELTKAKVRLEQSQDKSIKLATQVNTFNKQIDENIKQIDKETFKRDQNRERNMDLSKSLSELENERFKMKKEYEQMKIDNEALQVKINLMKQKYDEELGKLNETLLKKEDKLEKINKKIIEKQINIEEMERDRTNMEQSIKKEEKNKERLIKDKEKSEEQLKVLEENLVRTKSINQSVNQDVVKESKRYELRQETLAKQVAELKKQVNEERNAVNLLAMRINNDLQEYQESIVDSKLKKQQFENRITELDRRLKDLDESIKELSERKNLTDKQVNELEINVKNAKIENKQTEEYLLSKINELEPLNKKLESKNDNLNKKLTQMKTHTIELNKKIDEMIDSKGMMLKTIDKLNDDIQDLTNINQEIDIRHESTKALEINLKTSLNDVNTRISTNRMNHIQHVDNRNSYLNELKQELDVNINLNKELASKYRFMKYQLYFKKLELILKIEKSSNEHDKVKDKRQVKVLQLRMHNVLNDYFTYQIKYSNSILNKLLLDNNENGFKINQLEKSLNFTVDEITSFLSNQVDFKTLREQAHMKVHKEELLHQNALNSARSLLTSQSKPRVNFNLSSTQVK